MQAYITLIIGMIIVLHRKANIKCDAQSRETCAVNKFTKEKRQKKQNKKKIPKNVWTIVVTGISH